MALPLTDPGEVGFDAERLARIDRHFQRYVDQQLLPGFQVLVSRHGRLVHSSTAGAADVEHERPWVDNTIARLFSMTKPVTSLAAMMLYEEGAFQLKDPVAEYIPAFAQARVYREGSTFKPVTEAAIEPMRIWHLLTHTSGLTYGFHHQHVTDALYRAAGFEWGAPAGADLGRCCELWAGLPLAFQPGTEWLYGVSTDVLGHVIEIVSGQPLDEFLQERIFGPLGMVDTGFWVPDDKADRVARLYSPHPLSGHAFLSPLEHLDTSKPAVLSGGGGLYGTADDYLKFCHLLLAGGELDGQRLIGNRTLDFMVQNHLPGGVDLEAFGRPLFAETTFDGVGFGLGFSVVTDPVANKVISSPGEFAWGGAASTAFWCDPWEDVAVVFLTQLLPSSTHPIRTELRQLVYQALIG